MMQTEDITRLIQDLSQPDPAERRSAAETLASADERALYPLIRALRDENAGVQDAAMRSLVAIGGEPAAYMTLPLLREGPLLRNTARIILKQIGTPAVPLLHPLLADKDDDVRTFAVDLIADIGSCEYPEELLRLLRADPNQNVRSSAALAIGALGLRSAAPALVAALRDNEWVCFSALEALSAIRDEASIDPIGALLADPSDALRYAAIEALGKIGSGAASALLLERLARANDLEKNAIIRSVVQIGVTPAMAEVADGLLELFKNGDWDDRTIALAGLADLQDERAVPLVLDIAGALDPSDPANEERLLAVKNALTRYDDPAPVIAALDDRTIKFRGKVIAIEVLGELASTGAVPHLVGLMTGDLREVRRACANALAAIGNDEALSALRACIDDRDGHVRRVAIATLGRTKDASAFPRLLDHLAGENYADVLEETVQALLAIDSSGLFARVETLPAPVKEILGRFATDLDMLLALSCDADGKTKVSALSGLGRIRNERAEQRLSEALREPEPEVRKAAVLAIGRLGSCFGELQFALQDPDLWVRLYAVRALGESGMPGVDKMLIPLLYDKEAPVVIAAIDALLQLGNREAVLLSALQGHQDAAVRERIAQAAESL